jgi:hypothetical protein
MTWSVRTPPSLCAGTAGILLDIGHAGQFAELRDRLV